MSNSPFINEPSIVFSPCSPQDDEFVKSKNSGKVVRKKWISNCVSPYDMNDYNLVSQQSSQRPISPQFTQASPFFFDPLSLASPVKTPDVKMEPVSFFDDDNFYFELDQRYSNQEPFYPNPITYEHPNPPSFYFQNNSEQQQQQQLQKFGRFPKLDEDRDVIMDEQSSEDESLGEKDDFESDTYIQPVESCSDYDDDEMDCTEDNDDMDLDTPRPRKKSRKKKRKRKSKSRGIGGGNVKFVDALQRVVVHVGERKTFRLLNNLIYYRKSTVRVSVRCRRRFQKRNVNIFCHLEYKSYKRSFMSKNPEENRWKTCDYPGEPRTNTGGVQRSKNGGKEKGLFVDYSFPDSGNEIEISYCITFNVKEMCRNTGKNFVRIHFSIFFGDNQCSEIAIPMLWDTHGKPKGNDRPVRVKQLVCEPLSDGYDRITYKLGSKRGKVVEVDDYLDDVEPILVRRS